MCLAEPWRPWFTALEQIVRGKGEGSVKWLSAGAVERGVKIYCEQCMGTCGQ